ncbi:MAG: DUF924 domain-containing protein [Deltaproteobacteria bacterium]|nr:DUF924 domain-containing protein [Deltaproteobacteria bacterium]MBW2418108.1 DUF924 domain-containing protein [Deltaproteobacteria bacterium]
MVDCEDLLDFWFGADLESPAAVEGLVAKWFGGGPEFDREIAEHFGALPERALRGELARWEKAPRTSLALVIALDQLPRNLYRSSSRSYEFDPLALEKALGAIERGFDSRLHPLEATFLYLPLEHAEDLALQERCVGHFTRLVERAPAATCYCYEGFVDYACSHRDVVREFGRFPHRNAPLGRSSTPEERAYLAGGGTTFGASDAGAG